MYHDRHMIRPGDPTFIYGQRQKRGHSKPTAGRGFDDVFMTDVNFDSFLPMDDFGHLRMNDTPFGAGQSFPGRYEIRLYMFDHGSNFTVDIMNKALFLYKELFDYMIIRL